MSEIVIEGITRVEDGKLVQASTGEVIVDDISEYELAGGYAGELLLRKKGEYADVKYDHFRMTRKD